MAKIYLINPRCPDTFWGLRYAQELAGFSYSLPNLALPTLAALTPAPHEVVCCDENVTPIDFDTDADVVGITGYTLQADRMFALAAAFRERGKLVVLGGPFASLVPEACREHADVLFVGEAERTWPAFIDDLSRGKFADTYEEKEKVSLAESPVPRWDTMPVGRYGSLAIQTTRGCPFDCEFCDIIVLFGRKVRPKPIDRVIDEIRLLVVEHGADSIFFTDDNFIGNRRYAKDLLRAIVSFRKGLKSQLNFYTQVSLNLALDQELLELMVEAGFNRVFVGIESPRKDSLLEANKRHNVARDIIESIRTIQRSGLVVWAGMIVGFDSDDTDIFREQYEFLQAAGIPLVMSGMLVAPHKTPLWKRLEQDGRLWSEEGFANNFASTNVIPKQMSRKQLFEGYRWLIQELYTPRAYEERLMTAIESIDTRVASGARFGAVDVKAAELWKLAKICFFFMFHRDESVRSLFWRMARVVARSPAERVGDVAFHLACYAHFERYVSKDLLPQLNLRIEEEQARASDPGPGGASSGLTQNRAYVKAGQRVALEVLD